MPKPPRRFLTWTSLLLLLGAAAELRAQPYGLDAPVPVGAFLNGALPSLTPLGPGNSTWDVGDAFPSLPLVDTLVIAANPAETNPASDRLYVGSRQGILVSFPNDPAAATADPFLDLTDRVAEVWDGGFLGLAFHPDFGIPGALHERSFFVYYSSHCPLDGSLKQVDLASCDPAYPRGSTGGFFGTYLRLSRFEVFDAQAAVLVGDPTSEEPLLNIRLYNGSHRGGGPVFGHDGYLYLAIGDQFRYDTAQQIDTNLEGGTLRLDVDGIVQPDDTVVCPTGSHTPIRRMQAVTGNPDEMSGRHYCIPDTNPWPSPGGLTFEEYWSIGHRNPHRIAVDPESGRLWSGEVGASTREEVNVLVQGGNFGWPFREGLVSGPRSAPPVVLGTLTDPVIDFVRAEARAIIGGYVYRGSQFPELEGRYIAGDYVTANIWAITLDPVSMTATKELLTTFAPGALGTFGQDGQGEILLGSVAGTVPLQSLVRLSGPPADAPPWLSQIGAFADLGSLQPAPFFVPFEPVPFWSDDALKQRWAAVPNDGTHDQPGEQIAWSETGDWDFPNGSVLMKHFELGVDDADPIQTTRLETRLLVRGNDSEWYGLAYRWLEDGTDAYLLTARETRIVDIATIGGGTRQQTWTFPSRLDCRSCHGFSPGRPLGPRTHGLNRSLTYPATGRSDNQLRTWNHLGLFTPSLMEAQIPTYPAAPVLEDVTASLENRARSWLDANCAACHQPGTTNRAVFDARYTTPVESQGLVWGPVMDDLGVPDAHVVTPGNPMTSIALQRAAALGPIAMPPLLKGLVHQPGLDRLYDWILRIDPAFPRIGVDYEYFEITGLSVLPDFDAETPITIGSVDTFDISPRLRDDDFAFRFTAWVDVPTAGDWTFYTSSDDGSQLLIDDVLVVDNDGLHATQEASGTVLGLTAGPHAIEVTFFERGGQQVLDVSWEGPGVTKSQIPPGRLYLQPPVPIVNAPPAIAPIAPQLSAAAQPLFIPVATADPDGDLLHVEASGLPPGTSWNEATSRIEGPPDLGADGVYTVIVGVSDGPAVAATSFVWTVVPPQCSNGVDDDGDGLIDWDGGGSGSPDPQCGNDPAGNQEKRFTSACGLGAELLPVLAVLGAVRRRLRG